MAMNPKWLEWAQRLQAIAQNGLTYAQNPFDRERYETVREIAAEIMAAHSGVELGYVRNLFAGDVGYATPKVDVRGAVFRDEAILLVKERQDGLWTLPGGWADVGESPSEAVVREVYEESGYHTRAVKLLALYDRNRHAHAPFPSHVYKLFFQCELLGGDPALSLETDGVAFFREDEIPELSLLRVTPTQIVRLFEHYRNADWPTDFD
jgi:ADP-ribose pyrophosphatase YjhB (NUDIX family)